MKEQIKKLDGWVYAAERGFTVAALAVMSVVVFFDVVHRTFASQENKAVAATVKLLSYFGRDIEPGSGAYNSLDTVMPYITWTAAIGLTFFAIRSANTRDKVPALRAFIYAGAGVLAAYGLVQLFIKLVPNGLIWSQPLALVLTLWVGFVAASMCTYENKHLKVEAVQRVLPPKIKPYIVFASGIFTAFVCVTLMWLSLRYVAFNYDEYASTQGQGGLFQGLDVPKYQCFLALPIAFFFMTVRFTAKAIVALGGELPPEPEIEGLEELAKASRQPSEVATEVSGKELRSPAGVKRPPSEVPTEAVSVGEDGEVDGATKLPQSKIPTDGHASAKRDEGSGEAEAVAADKAEPAGADDDAADSEERDA